MSIGLIEISRSLPRELRAEFITHVDPHIMEGLKYLTTPPGILNQLENYSRSYYSKEAHIASILKYRKQILDSPANDEWTQTVDEAKRLFASFQKVPVMSAKPDSRNLKKVKYHQGTSAGYGYHGNPHPYPSHKGAPNGPNHKRAVRIAAAAINGCDEAFNAGTWNEFLDSLPMDSTPDVAFTRTQLTELPKFKVRNVFGEAFHYVLLEGLFAQPLIEQFMRMDTFYYIGDDPITGVSELIDSIPPDREQFLVFDWSGFDSSVQTYEIELAFDLLESMIIFPDNLTHLVYQYVRKLFISRKLASPDGVVYLRISGIPSGSYFTHIVGSIINYIRITYLLKRFGVSIYKIRTHGDDCFVVPLSQVTSLTGIVTEAATHGWSINLEKSQLLHDRHLIEFLGRSSKYGTNYRDQTRALRLLVYPEYPVDDPQISIARLKGIFEDTGSRIPLFVSLYHYMNQKFGDQNVDLPRQFKRFVQSELYSYDPVLHV